MNSYYQDVEVANLSDRSINDEYMEVSGSIRIRYAYIGLAMLI